jgi:hypothetical protein
MMQLLRKLLAHTGLADRRTDQRMDAQGLSVSYAAGSEHKKVRIGNISPTGLYLFTEERWQPGAIVLLTLGEKSIFDESSRFQVKLWTRCVRVDEQGAGLAFRHSHIDRLKWLEAMSKAPTLIASKNLVQVFRLTRAFAFLFHISPASEPEIMKLVTETLTHERTERALEIALQADDQLESQSCLSRTDVSPGLVREILERGVEFEEAEVREYWARLLATSSLSGSQDAFNAELVNLLSKLNPLHLRVLSAAWSKANQARTETGSSSPQDVSCTAEEIDAMAGVARIESVEWIVNDLNTFGLLGNTAKPEFGERLEQVNLSLSDLGRQLSERCFGVPDPGQNEIKNTAVVEQFVALDTEEVLPAGASEELPDSLASEAQTIRENTSVALLDSMSS